MQLSPRLAHASPRDREHRFERVDWGHRPLILALVKPGRTPGVQQQLRAHGRTGGTQLPFYWNGVSILEPESKV